MGSILRVEAGDYALGLHAPRGVGCHPRHGGLNDCQHVARESVARPVACHDVACSLDFHAWAPMTSPTLTPNVKFNNCHAQRRLALLLCRGSLHDFFEVEVVCHIRFVHLLFHSLESIWLYT